MWWKRAMDDTAEGEAPLPAAAPSPFAAPEPSSPPAPSAPTRDLLAELKGLASQMAAAAQEVYDGWDQDADGIDEHYGGGGICDDVADAMGDVAQTLQGVEVSTSYDDSAGHTSCIVTLPNPVGEDEDPTDGQAAHVDISPYVYERGAFYNWRKIPNVRFDGSMVSVWPIAYADATASGW